MMTNKPILMAAAQVVLQVVQLSHLAMTALLALMMQLPTMKLATVIGWTNGIGLHVVAKRDRKEAIAALAMIMVVTITEVAVLMAAAAVLLTAVVLLQEVAVLLQEAAVLLQVETVLQVAAVQQLQTLPLTTQFLAVEPVVVAVEVVAEAAVVVDPVVEQEVDLVVEQAQEPVQVPDLDQAVAQQPPTQVLAMFRRLPRNVTSAEHAILFQPQYQYQLYRSQ
jgi:hypothetical protein